LKEREDSSRGHGGQQERSGFSGWKDFQDGRPEALNCKKQREKGEETQPQRAQGERVLFYALCVFFAILAVKFSQYPILPSLRVSVVNLPSPPK
jgi:hypothetical protein